MRKCRVSRTSCPVCRDGYRNYFNRAVKCPHAGEGAANEPSARPEVAGGSDDDYDDDYDDDCDDDYDDDGCDFDDEDGSGKGGEARREEDRANRNSEDALAGSDRSSSGEGVQAAASAGPGRETVEAKLDQGPRGHRRRAVRAKKSGVQL